MDGDDDDGNSIREQNHGWEFLPPSCEDGNKDDFGMPQSGQNVMNASLEARASLSFFAVCFISKFLSFSPPKARVVQRPAKREGGEAL